MEATISAAAGCCPTAPVWNNAATITGCSREDEGSFLSQSQDDERYHCRRDRFSEASEIASTSGH
jgi:hypothetical protein